jgi:hypothetical protein
MHGRARSLCEKGLSIKTARLPAEAEDPLFYAAGADLLGSRIKVSLGADDDESLTRDVHRAIEDSLCRGAHNGAAIFAKWMRKGIIRTYVYIAHSESASELCLLQAMFTWQKLVEKSFYMCAHHGFTSVYSSMGALPLKECQFCINEILLFCASRLNSFWILPK